MKLPIIASIIIVFCGQAFALQASRSCFMLAHTVYEHFYCEIKAVRPNTTLPSFSDFKNNDEMTQALLLKKHDRIIGVDIKLPVKKTQKNIIAPDQNQNKTEIPREKTNNRGTASSNAAIRPTESYIGHGVTPECLYAQGTIRCTEKTFIFAKNRKNSDLPKNALTENNRLDFSVDQSFSNNIQVTTDIVTQAYVTYIHKMLGIGLAEATMTYSKFFFLFSDSLEKGYSFTDRLKIMFEYLKKDKKSIDVPIGKNPPQEISLKDCFQFEQLISCERGIVNYVFINAPS